MEREGGFLQSTIPLRKRPESRIKISAISIFRSGPTDSTPPFQLSKISKISIFLHKQTYHRLRGMPFRSTVRFQSNGARISHHSTLSEPYAPSSPIAIQRTFSSPHAFITQRFLFFLFLTLQTAIFGPWYPWAITRQNTPFAIRYPSSKCHLIKTSPAPSNLLSAPPTQSPQRYTYTNPTAIKTVRAPHSWSR